MSAFAYFHYFFNLNQPLTPNYLLNQSHQPTTIYTSLLNINRKPTTPPLYKPPLPPPPPALNMKLSFVISFAALIGFSAAASIPKRDLLSALEAAASAEADTIASEPDSLVGIF
jgi:hypothetical protein